MDGVFERIFIHFFPFFPHNSAFERSQAIREVFGHRKCREISSSPAVPIVRYACGRLTRDSACTYSTDTRRLCAVCICTATSECGSSVG